MIDHDRTLATLAAAHGDEIDRASVVAASALGRVLADLAAARGWRSHTTGARSAVYKVADGTPTVYTSAELADRMAHTSDFVLAKLAAHVGDSGGGLIGSRVRSTVRALKRKAPGTTAWRRRVVEAVRAALPPLEAVHAEAVAAEADERRRAQYARRDARRSERHAARREAREAAVAEWIRELAPGRYRLAAALDEFKAWAAGRGLGEYDVAGIGRQVFVDGCAAAGRPIRTVGGNVRALDVVEAGK